MIIFLTKDDKIHTILKPPGYFPFYYEDNPIVGTNNCEKWLSDVINILTSEDMENKPLGSKM